MRVDFDYLKYKNLGSYGNKMTTIDFTKGINLISASNGSGKSFTIEAFVFNLTGKPYRKLKKIKNLINRVNKKELYTETGFHIGKTYWKVVRTLSPDTLKYFKLDPKSGEYKEIDSLSSKSLDQAQIEKILKIDAFMIKQIVALDVSHNKPFLSLTAAETRAILESIFNLSVFSKMGSEIKTLLAGFEADLKISDKSLGYLEKNITSQEDNIDSMQGLLDSFNAMKETAIEKLQNKLTEVEDEIVEHSDNIVTAETYLEENKAKKTETQSNKIKSFDEKIGELQAENRIKANRLDLLGKGKCPTCATDLLSNPEAESELKSLPLEINVNKKEIDKLLIKVSKLEDKIKKIDEHNTEIKDIEFALKTEQTSLSTLEKQKASILADITAEEDKGIDFDINEIKAKLNDLLEEQEALEEETNKLKTKITNHKDVKAVLSDKGAKAFLMSKFIPLLNSKVQEYLKKFDLSIVISFNDLMQVEITNPKQPGTNIEYESFSKGEKKRLDMAILLSFIRVTKEICNWHCNIMFLDELLDGGLDAEGLDKVGQAIKSMVDEDDLSIYTISHRKLSYDLFDRYIYVEKDSQGFSNIVSSKSKGE